MYVVELESELEPGNCDAEKEGRKRSEERKQIAHKSELDLGEATASSEKVQESH